MLITGAAVTGAAVVLLFVFNRSKSPAVASVPVTDREAADVS